MSNVYEVKADGLPVERIEADSLREACDMYRAKHPEVGEARVLWRDPCYGWKAISR